MSQLYITPNGGQADNQKPLFYRSWLPRDRKGQALILAGVLVLVVVGVAYWTESLLGGFLAFCVLLASVWFLFLPVQIEINAEGIVRTVLRRKSFIAWEDIRSYQPYRGGFLLLPRKTRFFLEAFRGYFLPIPSHLMTEVQYRFRVYVDRSEHET